MPVPQESDFLVGTKFFVKGAGVPVAVLPDRKASSWYGGTPTHWDNAHLIYATRESQQRFVEVSYAEFARLVDQSIAKPMTEEERKAAEARVNALLAEIRARRERTDPADFAYARRGADGFPDPDAN